MSELWVNGVVSNRDKKPYVQLSNEKGIFAQLSVAQARKVAMDILAMVHRTEADAMIIKFFSKSEFPVDAAMAMLIAFRDFRHELDMEKVEGMEEDPDTGRRI